jgi:hypothetical protein
MPKGSQQTGTQTVQQVNPAAEAQLPYLKETWDTAQAFYKNLPTFSQRYYPNPTVAGYAPPSPWLNAGYEHLITTGRAVDQDLRPFGNDAFQRATGGAYGVQSSPAYGGFQQFAQGQAGPQQQFGNIYNAAYGSAQPTADAIRNYAMQGGANNNVGLNSLMGLAQGQGYGNPYLSQAIQGAIDPLVRNYQTAISPQIDAAASAAGRYGSGAQAGMVDTAQQNLARGIGNVTSSMQNAAYEAERGRQLQAAGLGGQLYNQGLGLGIQGMGAAGNQYIQALQQAQSAAQQQAQGQQYGLTGLQSGYQSGNAAALQALGYYPQLAQAQYSSPLAEVQAGQGIWGIGKDAQAYQQQLIDADKARFDYNTKLPWTDLGLYQQAIGGALGGSQTTSQPIYGNPTAEALAGLTGISSIGRNLGLFGSGGSGLFGSAAAGAGGLTAANMFGAGPAIAAFNAAPAAAALPVAVAEPAAMIASIFGLPFGSDRRLKEDDQVVGLLGDLPIHTFRYKGDPVKRVGFMADEVEKIDPGAVTTMPNGYKAVYYGRAAQSALNSMMGEAK